MPVANPVHTPKPDEPKPLIEPYQMEEETKETSNLSGFSKKRSRSRERTPEQPKMLRDCTCKFSNAKTLVDSDDFVCLKMRGLPFAATADEIHQFFEGLGMIPDSVKFACFEDGRRTG
jgi:hypothetical protein